MMHIRADSCDDSSAQIECNDDGGQGNLSKLEFERLEPDLYFVFVDGFGLRSSGGDNKSIYSH